VKGQEKYFQQCGCITDLGESCSHVASPLWAIIQFSKILTTTVKESSVPAPSETELSNFLICIEKCLSEPALLSLIPAHSDSYIPNALHPELPDALSNLFDSSLVEAFLFIIIVIVISIVIIVTKLLLACTKLLLGKVWFVISWVELSNIRTSIFQTWIAWTFLSGSIHTHVHVDYNKLINWLKLTFYPFLISE